MSKVEAAQWVFAKQRNNDPTGRNPIFGNFKNEGWSDCQAFVREFLQNTLDNRRKDADGKIARARVRFRILTGTDSLDSSFIEKSLASLEPHLVATGLSTALRDYKHPRVLVVEEFETTGFGGTYNDSRADGDFASFFHGEANDTKTGGKNGRAGQGKATYNMISDAGALIVLTVREGDGKALAMGKAFVPRTHDVGGDHYLFRGFLSDWHQDEQPVPFEDEASLKAIADAFKLERTLTQLGSSFIIPFPKPEVNEENIVRVILEEYFYSIIKGRLEVEVGETKVNSETVFELIENEKYNSAATGGHEAPSKAFLHFIKQATDLSASKRYTAQKSFDGSQLSQDLFAEGAFAALSKDFLAGEIVWVRLPVDVHPRVGPKKTSFIDVFVREGEDIVRTEEAFIRRDLYISKEKKLRSYFGHVQALVIAEDEPISECLAYAEVASHLLWNASEEKFVERYKRSTTLPAVRASARRLLEALLAADEEVSNDLLLDVISIAAGGATKKGTGSTRKGRRKLKRKKVVTIKPGKRYHEIRDGEGIRVQPGPDAIPAAAFPLAGKLEVAYENLLGSGNPFSNYHPFDFDLAETNVHKVDSSGIKIIERAENKIEFVIENPNWHLEVNGFDENKPLRARARLAV
jgi:hypothetical protein